MTPLMLQISAQSVWIRRLPVEIELVASSTTMPTASNRPNSDRLFSDISEHQQDTESADERNRNGDHGDERSAPGLQEKEDHGHDEQDRNEDRLHHLANRLSQRRRGWLGLRVGWDNGGGRGRGVLSDIAS